MSEVLHSCRREFSYRIFLLLPLVLPVIVFFGGGVNGEDEDSVSNHSVVREPGPVESIRLGRGIGEIRGIRGFAIAAHHIGDLDLYLKSVDRIAEMGANALIVVTPMWQRKVDSSVIRVLKKKCPTDEQLVTILKKAHARGMHTTLLPIVLIEKPGKKEWRGKIRPKDWDRWWGHYDKLMDRFIGIANEAKVDLLGIGSELNSTEDQRERWERIVEYTRKRFRPDGGGQLTYSSNWDRYDKVELWDLVDVISVSSYFELDPEDNKAPHETLVAAWTEAQGAMMKFAKEWERPLLLTEVGYPSLKWATAHPWNYVPKMGMKADHEAQARGWRAFFDAWRGVLKDPSSRMAGFFCYHWDPYHQGGERDTGYGVWGKPAYAIIRENFQKLK